MYVVNVLIKKIVYIYRFGSFASGSLGEVILIASTPVISGTALLIASSTPALRVIVDIGQEPPSA